MKLKLLILTMVSSWSFAQTPEIAGDLILCPESSGTAYIVNDMAYDSYQWYFKYWFTSGEFQEIPGANGPTFVYDWWTYDQALLKVVVTFEGQTYESNTIQIDSYAWLPISTGFELAENVSINPENGNVMLCEGTSFTVEVFMPYTIVQWFRNDEAIPGATSMQYEVTGPGVYHVEAAPEFCPDNVSSSQGTPMIVEIDTNCGLDVGNPQKTQFAVWPNPTKGTIHLSDSYETVRVVNLAGQVVKIFENPSTTIDVSSLQSGMYLLEAETDGAKSVRKIVVE